MYTVEIISAFRSLKYKSNSNSKIAFEAFSKLLLLSQKKLLRGGLLITLIENHF